MNDTFYTTPEEPQEEDASLQTVEEPALTRRHFSRIGWGYVVLMLGLMAGAYAIQIPLLYVWPEVLSAWWMAWVISLLPLYGVGLPLLWLVLRRVSKAPHNPLYTNSYAVTREKPSFTFGKWMVLLVIGLGCMYAGGLVGNIIMYILSAVMRYDYANGLNDIVSNSPVWMTFVATCICAPLGEEFLFRKLLIDRTRGYGDRTAILLSGLLFALFHGNLFQFFYAFLLGLILAYMYTRSGNLWWCVAMHAVVNLLGSIIIPGIASVLPADGVSFTNPWQILATLFLVAWQYGFIIMAIVLICVLWRRRILSQGSVIPEKGAAAIFLNPGMIACLAVMILLTLVSLIPPLG